jgi:hypothetical protein
LRDGPPGGIEGTKLDQSGRFGRRLAMFIFVVSLFSILVVSAAWYIATLNPVSHEVSCEHGNYSPLVFTIQQSRGNWTLTSTCSKKAIQLNEVTLTIYDFNGTIVNPMRRVMLANLTEGNWATYQVVYLKVGDEDYVRQGAQIIIDATRYRSGYRWELANHYSILVNGMLG